MAAVPCCPKKANSSLLEEVTERIQKPASQDDTFVDEGFETLEVAHDFLNLFKNKK
jgi:hypothetical protein